MERKIIVTKSFKRSILKVVLALVLFFLFYMALIGLSIALLIGCAFGARFILSFHKTGFIGLTASAGLMVLGIMFFLFAIKFIFARFRSENPYRIEIFEHDHPRLFDIIYKVADNAGAHHPHKVFLIQNINAGVFFNSSFLSLIFPVRKNLEIGLGLMNSVNTGEFKAILAHEFGHHSQKSMRLGSYIYTVNHVIYNLVNEYDRWDKLLESWANIGGLFAYFARITFEMVEFVRRLLKIAYAHVNKPYMGLLREMEFHADQVAAFVAGRNNIINALRRIQFSQVAFDHTFHTLDLLAEDHKISSNIYPDHAYQLNRTATYFGLEFDNGLPVIKKEDNNKYLVKLRVNYKDQWATHPPLEEREKNINEIRQENPKQESSGCWELLDNIEYWQKKLTRRLYEVNYGNLEGYEVIDHDKYLEFINLQRSKYNISDLFNGFYDNRDIFNLDYENLSTSSIDHDLDKEFRETYNQDLKIVLSTILSVRTDISILHDIKEGYIQTKTFEFDNKQYDQKDAGLVIPMLAEELKQQMSDLKALDEKAARFNLAVAKRISDETSKTLIQHWRILAEIQDLQHKNNECFARAVNYLNLLKNNSWNEGSWNRFLRDLDDFESEFKGFILKYNLQKCKYLTENQVKILDDYIKYESKYINIKSFDIQGFNDLLDLITQIDETFLEKFRLKLKETTDYQVNMYLESGLKLGNTAINPDK